MTNADLMTNHTPYLFLLVPSKIRETKTKLRKLLPHFCRWRDCTEHVQQAFKPL